MIALVLIDVQLGLQEAHFYGSERNNPNAEINAGKILEVFRKRNLPVFHVRHNSSNLESPLHPSKSGNAFHPLVQPMNNEPIFQKSVNSAFIGTPLEDQLKLKNIEELVIVGLTIEHCVSTSVRMAANLGFKVDLISDATAAFDKIGINGQKLNADLIHNAALANLKDEFATIKNTETILNELAN
ncbi:cysteine hydrolase family protein [Flagellimonas onchidii]|uniref:cysteine hydrolase family protein n=1 Tax=Flagellimonas onchidii TaxID=2562684 RepID=UPI0010A5E910|nr:cysteine hydrolase family protein [Allomuricauda onchidii]